MGIDRVELERRGGPRVGGGSFSGRGRATSVSSGSSGGGSDSFKVEINESQLAALSKKFADFPLDGEKILIGIAKEYGQIGKRFMQIRGYSQRGGNSLGVGPGLKYGHVRDSVGSRASAIHWGMYIRVGMMGPKSFVAAIHEPTKNIWGTHGPGIKAMVGAQLMARLDVAIKGILNK